ncbi:MAG TPA: DUF5615 family PIN-like protein [Blastocatellia bacterium]|nr:DUF5615 family PIN-like protein [Blastocatellia bacterium]
MKVRYQADADLNHILVKAVLRREPSIEFHSTQAANLAGMNDHEVLAVAAQGRRVLETHDRKTIAEA